MDDCLVLSDCIPLLAKITAHDPTLENFWVYIENALSTRNKIITSRS